MATVRIPGTKNDEFDPRNVDVEIDFQDSIVYITVIDGKFQEVYSVPAEDLVKAVQILS